MALSRMERRVASEAKFSSSSSSSAISSGITRVEAMLYNGSGDVNWRKGDGSLEGIRLATGEAFRERVSDFRSSNRLFRDGRLELDEARDVERPLRSLS